VIGLLTASLLAGGVVVGCGSSTSSSGSASSTSSASGSGGGAKTLSGTTNITVGTGPVADFEQFFVAQKEGYFTQNHLNVKTVPVLSGPEGVAAVKSGSINFTVSATLPLFLANQSGLDLKYVGPGDTETPRHWQYYMAVKAGSSITTLQQAFAAGTKIGWIGSSTPNAIAVRLLMKKMGIPQSNVTFVTLAPPNITTALKSGEVKASIPLEPFTTLGLLQKQLKTVGGPLDAIMGNDDPTSGYMTSGSWASSHKPVVAAFDKSLTQATQFIDQNPAQATAILASSLKLPLPVAKALYPIQFVSHLSTPGVQNEIKEANSVGLLSKKLDGSSLFVSP
jgi:NitT/TauT family transport system substrate-binding protein